MPELREWCTCRRCKEHAEEQMAGLVAERDRLREALDKLVTTLDYPVKETPRVRRDVAAARAALENRSEGEGE